MVRAVTVSPRFMPWYEAPKHKGAYGKDLITPENSDAEKLAVRLFYIEPGGMAEPHSHKVMEHTFYVIKGSLLVICDGEKHQLCEGDIIHIPPGVTHEVYNTGSEPTVILASYAPPKDE